MESAIANVDLGRYRRLVQMIWDPEPSNDTTADQPIWCLGCRYRLAEAGCTSANEQTTQSETATENNTKEEAKVSQADVNAIEQPTDSAASSFSSIRHDEANGLGDWPSDFILDFESKFWMTYRNEFTEIPKSEDPKAAVALSLPMRIKYQVSNHSGFSSDTGWGCMIRSGQSLLANTLCILRLGRSWRRGQEKQKERTILSLFADDTEAPFSIHRFVQHGASACEKYPGEWFGPSATAQCIQALVNGHSTELSVYSTGDGPDVYEESFMKVACANGHFRPTLILVGTRLGIDKITRVYWEALISALQMPQSVGIAGGRPSSSHYFVGSQGSFLFYLDPHHTRKAFPYRPNPNDYTDEEIDSCHTARLRRLHVQEMDPSMLIGFLIKNQQDWEDWRRRVKYVQGKAIIHVADRDPSRGGGLAGRDGAIDEVETLSDDDDTEHNEDA
ncbi:hypothetical protein Golomagni_05825 [Golovinomyces magnicellulatus]|nr:hypothetical protein Golomagni_05825 [Golovinomyces magnicellulatus]